MRAAFATDDGGGERLWQRAFVAEVEDAGDVRAAGRDVEALSGQVEQVFEVVRAGAVVRLVQQTVDGAQERFVVRAFVAADAADGGGGGWRRVVGVEEEGAFQELFERVVVRVAQGVLVAVHAGGITRQQCGQDVQAEAAAVAFVAVFGGGEGVGGIMRGEGEQLGGRNAGGFVDDEVVGERQAVQRVVRRQEQAVGGIWQEGAQAFEVAAVGGND